LPHVPLLRFGAKKGSVPINPINGIDCSSLLSKYEEWNEVVKNCYKEVINVLQQEEERDNTQYYNPTLLEKSEWQ